ncbi:MAG: Multicopper oxidase [Frankiales bacterium]|nr:Multicopper oxidase [Frankiales bacterium]
MRPRLWAVFALLLGLLVPGGALAAPGDVGGSIVVALGGATAGYVTKVAVEPQGTPLTFYNLDQLAHTVTAVDRDADGRPLFSGNALPSSTSTIAGVDRLRAGTYAFFCSFHPNMSGSLIVEGGKGGVGPSAPRYEQKLRIPPVLSGANITLTAEQADVPILSRRPPTTMLTYNGTWPGPTIRRPVGKKTTVTVVNQLPSGVGSLSLHLHGDHHSSADDGQPAADLVSPGRKKTYTFPLTDSGRPERAAFSFYHDHRMDVTGRNNWYGLQGMFITDDPAEAKLKLPSGAYDLPLMVADRSFDEAGQLTDPFPKPNDPKTLTAGINGPYAPPGDATTGARTLVNGGFQPYADVATHRYRLRLLNASSFSTYDFHFSDGRPMVQVGNGSALLPKPVSRTDILLGPAERADVVVDFGKDFNKKLVLESVARVDGRPGGIGSPITPIMQFRVGKRVADASRVPAALMPLPPLAVPSVPTMTWAFGLGVSTDKLGTTWTINGKAYDHMRVDATVALGSVQHWLLVNTSPLTHFIHLHEEAWRTVARNGLPPPAWEAGYQDTWRLDPGDVVEVAARITDHLGPFLIHCHMLDHEDHGMMATFVVVKPGAAKATPLLAQHLSGTSLSAITSAALCRKEFL